MTVTKDMAVPFLPFAVSYFSTNPFDTSDKRSFLLLCTNEHGFIIFSEVTNIIDKSRLTWYFFVFFKIKRAV